MRFWCENRAAFLRNVRIKNVSVVGRVIMVIGQRISLILVMSLHITHLPIILVKKCTCIDQKGNQNLAFYLYLKRNKSLQMH